jgi:hypothetical protein
MMAYTADCLCQAAGPRHRLQPETLAGTVALCANRDLADRQQPGRKRYPADRPGQKELVVYLLRTLRAQRRRNSKLAGHRQTQRPRTRRLA